jgi:hypothetical protein
MLLAPMATLISTTEHRLPGKRMMKRLAPERLLQEEAGIKVMESVSSVESGPKERLSL